MQTSDLELLLSILALIVGGVQLIPPHNQAIVGWICIFVGAFLLIHFIYKKTKDRLTKIITKDIQKLEGAKGNFEELARSLDVMRDSIESGLEIVKGRDEKDPKYMSLFLIQKQVHELGIGIKRLFSEEIKKGPPKKEELKTRLDLWDDFLNSTKQKAQKTLLNPTIHEYSELYKNFDCGLKTSLKESDPEYGWFLGVTYETKDFLIAHKIYGPGDEKNNPMLKKLIETVLKCIEYFQKRNPPFTAIDLRDFEPKDLKRYYEV